MPYRPELEDKLCEAVDSAQARLKRAKGSSPQTLGDEKLAARRELNDAVKNLHQLTVLGKEPSSCL